FITYLFVCNVCWKVHEPGELADLPESGLCTLAEQGCPGRLFRTKRMAEDKLKRSPVKTMPFVPLENVVAHLLSRRGKFEGVQLWRKAGDEPGERVHDNRTGYDAFDDLTCPMEDIYDG
ncbi:hypothetical protein BDN72DRAFT_749268, partial [Pluteus cervinus]